jgi:hypothetical protein
MPNWLFILLAIIAVVGSGAAMCWVAFLYMENEYLRSKF